MDLWTFLCSLFFLPLSTYVKCYEIIVKKGGVLHSTLTRTQRNQWPSIWRGLVFRQFTSLFVVKRDNFMVNSLKPYSICVNVVLYMHRHPFSTALQLLYKNPFLLPPFSSSPSSTPWISSDLFSKYLHRFQPCSRILLSTYLLTSPLICSTHSSFKNLTAFLALVKPKR